MLVSFDPNRSWVCAYIWRQVLAAVFGGCGDAAALERCGEGCDCSRGGEARREHFRGSAQARDQAKSTVPLAADGKQREALNTLRQKALDSGLTALAATLGPVPKHGDKLPTLPARSSTYYFL